MWLQLQLHHVLFRIQDEMAATRQPRMLDGRLQCFAFLPVRDSRVDDTLPYPVPVACHRRGMCCQLHLASLARTGRRPTAAGRLVLTPSSASTPLAAASSRPAATAAVSLALTAAAPTTATIVVIIAASAISAASATLDASGTEHDDVHHSIDEVFF